MLGSAFQNSNCDGDGPHIPGEVRALPIGNGNAILCRGCFQHEMAWRKERNRGRTTDLRFETPAWDSIEPYIVQA